MEGNLVLAIGGENLIDFVSEEVNGDNLPKYIANPGGSPFNVAIAAARQGQNVSYLTPISEDCLGSLLFKRLQDSGVSIAAPRVPEPTSLAIVSLLDGNPSYSFHRNGTAERQLTSVGLENYFPKKATLFHVGSLGLIDGDDAEVWEQFFLKNKERGVLTSLDPNVRPSLITDRSNYEDRIFRMMLNADIFKLSDEDLLWLYPNRPLEKAIEDCRSACNAVLFIVTLGAEGSLGYVGHHEVRVSAPKVKNLIDTVGAGDTFMATILSWIMETRRLSREKLAEVDESALREVMLLASAAAKINCERVGCNPPERHELYL